MHRFSAMPRRQAFFALAALVGASVTGCAKPGSTATPRPATSTAIGAPPTSVSSTAAATAIVPTPTAVPTLPPPSNAEIATGTALASTSAALSRTATSAADTTSGLTAIPTGGASSVSTTASPSSVSTIASASTSVPTSTNVPTPVAATTTPTTQAIIDKARTRFDKVNALHFTLAVEGQVFLDMARTERLTAADGDLIRPDRVSLTARVSVSSINAQLKFIQIADMAYLTNILTGRWQAAPAGLSYDPRVVFDPQNGVSAIMGQVNTWSLVEMTKVNGTDTQHLRGFVPTAAASVLVSNSLRGDYIDVDAYIEGKNSDVVKLILAEQPAAITDGTPASKWTLDLSKQNESLKIDAPTIGAQAPR